MRRKLGNSSDHTSGRRARRPRYCRTNLHPRFARYAACWNSDSTGRDRYPTGWNCHSADRDRDAASQSRNPAREPRNAAGWNCYSARRDRHPAGRIRHSANRSKYARIDFAIRDSKCDGFNHAVDYESESFDHLRHVTLQHCARVCKWITGFYAEHRIVKFQFVALNP